MATATRSVTALATVRRLLKANPNRTIWSALHHARAQHGQAAIEAAAVALRALSARATYLEGKAAVALVDRALAPAPAVPSYDLRGEACEMGEWEMADLEAAMREPVVATWEPPAAVVEAVPAARHPELWQSVRELAAEVVSGWRSSADVHTRLTWLCARSNELRDVRQAIARLRRLEGDSTEVQAAERVVGRHADELRRLALSCGGPVATRVGQRLAVTAA